MAWTSYFRFLLINTISLLNLSDYCSKHTSIASGDFFYYIVLFMTPGTLEINYYIIFNVFPESDTDIYWG